MSLSNQGYFKSKYILICTENSLVLYRYFDKFTHTKGYYD